MSNSVHIERKSKQTKLQLKQCTAHLWKAKEQYGFTKACPGIFGTAVTMMSRQTSKSTDLSLPGPTDIGGRSGSPPIEAILIDLV